MKKLFCTFGLIALCGTLSAQDIILKKDANEIQAQVIKVDQNTIEYKRWDNLGGPIYTIAANEVFMIKYQNGSQDVISANQTSSKRTANKVKSHYQGEIALGYGLGVGVFSDILNLDRIAVETVHGARFNPYVFAGVGLGFNYFYDLECGVLPIFVDVKGYYPFSEKAAVHLAVDLGAAIGAYNTEGSDFYASIGPGINIGSFNFGIRFQYMGTGLNAMLFRLGISF